MHPNYYLSPLAVAVALGMASPVKAAEPMPLQKASFTEIQQKFHLSVPGVMKSTSVTGDSLQFVRQHTDANKMIHVRMQQQYAGFPVFGGYAIMHSKSSSKLLATTNSSNVQMNGVVYQGLHTELGQPDASFIQKGVVALQQFKAKYASNRVSEEQVTPMVYIDDQHHAHWAYKVSVFVSYDDKIPERPTAIIDAQTNKSFIEWNDVKTVLKSAKGVGFGGNHKVGEYQYGKELPLLELSRDDDAQMCFMENKDVKVIDMLHKYYSKNKPMEFSCTNSDNSLNAYFTGYAADGYDKDNGAASPTNDALYAGYVIKHMYHDWYGMEVLTKSDGSPMQLVMRVHYGEGYENAYWDSKQMTFGDGDTMMYPLVSLGVGGHEISHGFTEQHSGLEYYGQSGGMNEAFSDMAAQAAEYYSVGKNSWQIGPEIMKEDSGYDALRYMDKPSRDGSSIDTADDYYGGLDVHYSSGVYNRLFYILSNQPEWNVRKAFDVMVKANIDYWTPYASFEEGGCGVLSAAKDLGYSLDDVKKSLTEVTISYQSCFKEAN